MGDEGFNQYPGQPLIGAASQAAPPPQWSDHDRLTLQRLQGAWGYLNDQVRDRILSPDEPMTLEARKDIGGQLQELTARQQASENQAKQQQMQEALHQNAIQRAVAQQDAEHMASNFHKTVGSFTNPQTGKTTYFKPKDADQIDEGEDTSAYGFNPAAASASTDPNARAPGNTPVERQPEADPKLEAWMSAVGRAPTQAEIDNGTVDEYFQRHQSPEAQATRARWAAEGVPAQDARDVMSGKAQFQQRVSNGDGGSTVTTYQQGPSGMTPVARQDFDSKGQPVQPQAQKIAEPFRKQAERELGRREPPQFIQGPHGRPIPNPMWEHWDTAVRQTQGRIQQQDAAVKTEQRKQVATDYSDALGTHKLKDYADSADPHAAREDAIMGDFAKKHPNDPRVADWKARVAQRTAALGQKDPAAMSLNELATATTGPHTNVKDMIEKEEKKIESDGESLVGGGRTFKDNNGNEFDTTPLMPWKGMPHSAVVQEAQKRVRDRLSGMLSDTRNAKSQGQQQVPAQTPAQPPAPQGGQSPAPQPQGGRGGGAAPAPVAQRANDLRKKYDITPEGETTRAKAAEKGSSFFSWLTNDLPSFTGG